MALLEVQNLSVDIHTRHGVLHALKDVRLSINAGEILGIVGESGAGKSLTGSAILRLLDDQTRIVSGQVRLGELQLDALDEAAMQAIRGRRVGAIFQDPLTSLNPLYTVGQQLIQTILTHLPLTPAQARDRAIQLLADTGIPAPEARLNQYPHQFSGGMRQRVVIALALAADPELIIADEPTTALDVSIQAQIIELLVRVCRERHAAVMLITHDMGVIAEAADRVAVMYAGRVVEVGPVNQVIESPAHPYTQGLMASIPRLDGRVDRMSFVPGRMPRLNEIVPGCAFQPRCPRATPTCNDRVPAWLEVGGATQVACVNPLGTGDGSGALT
jgi:peptide/nickel transport system ATP-binding protein